MNQHAKKMIAPIVVTVLIILYYCVYCGVMASLIDGVWKILVGIIPLFLAIVMIGVCVQRIKEIKGGEEDDLSKY